jgi:DNA-binding NtrC family response regulator
MKILVVDGEVQVCQLLQDTLARYRPDDEVVAVGDGLAALAQLQQHRFDLVITDQHLSDMNGIVLAGYAGKRWPETPIILMSGNISVSLDYWRQCLGVSSLLRKPFTPGKLLAVVDEICPTSGDG